MPVSDPIADMLTRIRNAQSVCHEDCVCPWSRHKEEICFLLKKQKMIEGFVVVGEGKEKEIIITFSSEHPSITLTRVSKPGRRVYTGRGNLKPHLNGYGFSIVSTSKGIMTDTEARKTGIGGEVLCTIS